MKPCLVIAFAAALVLTPAAPAQFLDFVSVRLPSSEPQGLACEHFDADAFLDLVVADADGDVWMLPMEALGRPGDVVSLGTGVADTTWLQAGDLDGDGDVDLIMGGTKTPYTGPPIPFPPLPPSPLPPLPQRLLVGLNDGNAGFTWNHIQITLPETGIDGRLGYADGDADLDLFLLTQAGITVFHNDGAGGFVEGGSYPKTDPVHFPATGPNALVVDATTRLDVGDFDGDGVDDVAVVNNAIRILDFTTIPLLTDIPLNLVTVHLNDGAGALSIGSETPTGPRVKHLRVADFDADGLADFAVLVPGSAPTPTTPGVLGSVETHLNGTTGFTATSMTTGHTPWQLVATDFDGDNDVDVASVGYNQYLTFPPPANFRIELTGHFNSGGTHGPGSYLGRVTGSDHARARDFDGDGQFDLVGTTWINDRAEIRFMTSSVRGWPLIPGTGDDLSNESSVNGDPFTHLPPDDVKTVMPGGSIDFRVSTPGGTFIGDPLWSFIGWGVFEWADNPSPASVQILNFPLYAVVYEGPMPPSGQIQLCANAPALIGFNFYVQFAAVSAAANNGQYAVTDAHCILVR